MSYYPYLFPNIRSMALGSSERTRENYNVGDRLLKFPESHRCHQCNALAGQPYKRWPHSTLLSVRISQYKWNQPWHSLAYTLF